MLKGELDEGDAVIRFKGDMESENTTMRDPTLMRIKKDRHYRQGSKYFLWPLYDLNTPINDFLNGVTDVIRDKNYGLRDALYLTILEAMGLKKPRIHPEARLVLNNNITSKRDLNILVKEGKIKGYDDPRLITIAALRRRGVRPEAIREFVMRFGMSKSESHVDISMLLDENKKLIDPEAKRLYYVQNPVKVTVEAAELQNIELKLHPTADMGSRTYAVSNTFYISDTDAKGLAAGDTIKLKNVGTVQVSRIDAQSITASPIEGESELKAQWVAERHRDCEVILPKPPLKDDGEFDDGSLQVSKGFVEEYASKLREGEVVQFERFGFCILDNKEHMSFIFITK
jgi:glutamyl-tRNA synthetase